MTDFASSIPNPFAVAALAPFSPPPHPFDLPISNFPPGYGANVRDLVESGAIDGFMRGGELWVDSSEVQAFLCVGSCIYDPFSPAYVEIPSRE